MFKLIGFATPPSGYGFTGAAASVQINDYLTGGAATAYLDDEVTTKTNPLTADSTGKYEACLKSGYYNIVVTYANSLGTVTHTRVRCYDSNNVVERNQGAGTVTKGQVVYTTAAGDFAALPGATATAANMRSPGVVLSASIAVGSRGFVSRELGDVCQGVGSAWTPGGLVYCSNAGVLSQTQPSGLCFVAGYALNATDLVFDPQDPSSILTAVSQLEEKNALINGAFDIWQRATTFAAAANAQYTADRWRYEKNGAQVVTISQSADVPTVAQSGAKFQYSLSAAVTTINASPAAGEYSLINQTVEGLRWRNLEGQAIAVSFWVKFFRTGTYAVSIRNAANTFSITRTFIVNSSNVWEKKTVLMPANTGTTFTFTSALSAVIGFTLMSGTTFLQATSNDGVWVGGQFMGETGQGNGMDSLSNTFLFAGVQVEAAATATPFERRTDASETLRCQRYHWKTFQAATPEAQNSGSVLGAITYRATIAGISTGNSQFIRFPAKMRAAPTMTTYNPAAANALWRNATLVADSGAASTVGTISEDAVCIGNAQAAGDVIGAVLQIQASFDAEM